MLDSATAAPAVARGAISAIIQRRWIPPPVRCSSPAPSSTKGPLRMGSPIEKRLKAAPWSPG